MNKLFLIAILLPLQCFAQVINESIQYYSNGGIQSVTRKIDNDIIEFIEYFPNGVTRDSVRLKGEVPIGVRKLYHDNRNLKYLIKYENGLREFEFQRYRPNGTLKAIGGRYNNKPFGPHKLYNKKGEVIRFQDLNKGRTILVPYKYRKGRHLTDSAFQNGIVSNEANLHRPDHKSRTIKSGALISVILKTDTLVRTHLQVEGFSYDSMFVSCFSYDLSQNKKTLKYDSAFAFGFNEIRTIVFAKNNNDLAELGAMTVSVSGLVLLLDPLILVPVFVGFKALLQPVTLALILSGPPLLVWGKHLYKTNAPRSYDLMEWSLRVTK